MTQRLVIVFALLCTSQLQPAAAQTAQVILKDAKGCKVINPFITSIDAVEVRWSGACKDGYISGPGTLTSIWSKETLQAEFDRGLARYGVFKEKRGIYEGPLEDNVPTGWGSMQLKSGYTLRCSFNHWVSAGRVEVQWPDGSRYQGEYDHQKDNITGRGKLTAADGSVYEGLFRSNKPEGQGTYRLATGDVRSGTFVKGKLSGQGSITYASGIKYSGRVLDDQPSGQGTLEYGGGGTFEGSFSKGLPQGRGRFVHPDGRILEGEFKAGALQVGTYATAQQKFEINLKLRTFTEILPDGTKQAVEPPELPNLAP